MPYKQGPAPLVEGLCDARDPANHWPCDRSTICTLGRLDFAAATAYSGRFDTSLANSFSRRFVNFQSAVLRFSPTTATNQMLIWIQDLKGNQQMYGLITELERKLGLRWPSEWTIPREKKCHCQIFTSMSVFTHRCMPQILHEN